MARLNRDELIAKLESIYPKMMLRPSEQFDGRKGGVWTSGEDAPKDECGMPLFDYWTQDNQEKNYRLGVRIPFSEMLEKAGWYCEYYDAGTVMVYPI